jgi:hypothetical protein
MGRMNNAQIWFHLEFKIIETKRQSLSDGFQRSFLQTPEAKECPQARRATLPVNGPGLGCRK